MTALLPMQPLTTEPLRVGEVAPDALLPDGRRLSQLRGAPVVLAFASPDWNPARDETVRAFSAVLRDFDARAVLLDVRPQDESQNAWRAIDEESDAPHELPVVRGLDPESEIAREFGVSGQTALFALDENGVARFVHVGENAPRTGEVLAALEALRAQTEAHSRDELRLSRRTFLASALAASFALTAAPMLSTANAQNVGTRQQPQDQTSGDTGLVPVTLSINGQKHALQIETRVSLLDALREELHLTGTKKGCDHGQCGACTVHIDGERALACLTLAVMNDDREITTIEGLAQNGSLHPVQLAFIEHDGYQCGYCTPGQIMSAVSLLREGHYGSEAEIREGMSGNLCRCGAYPNIIRAIKAARDGQKA